MIQNIYKIRLKLKEVDFTNRFYKSLRFYSKSQEICNIYLKIFDNYGHYEEVFKEKLSIFALLEYETKAFKKFKELLLIANEKKYLNL